MNKFFLIKVLILFLWLSFKFFAQISPGELTKFHSNLEGLSNCTKCHELGKQVLNSKCLDCHKEIKSLIALNTGYHSSSEVRGKDCWDCHSEHNGRNFRIINFSKNNFNHSLTGYELKGSHLRITCEKCHQSKFISNSKLKEKKETYLGLKSDCISCHEDFHKGSLGKKCNDCHNTEKFQEVLRFDHSKTAFTLTGEHLHVDCVKCHSVEVNNGKKQKKLKGLNFSNCSPCHSDVHKGSLGKDCKSCHVTKSFRIINQSTFNHSKTRFPLVGKHNLVKCNDCHKGSVSNKPLFAKCTDCHQDYHKGDFVVNQIITDCRDCHNEMGFSPSLFDIERHNKSKFSLEGAHLAVPCISCHKKEEQWKFRFTNFDCQSCHPNVHGNEITEKFLPGNNCQSCHNVNSWRTILFNHSGTGFELLGKHKFVECRDCHYKLSINNRKIFKFASLSGECTDCHQDIHFGQFAVDGKSDCLKCHSFSNWKAERFNHNNTRFSLEGAHSKLQCFQCHPSENKNGNSFIKYKLDDFKCAFCHSQRL